MEGHAIAAAAEVCGACVARSYAGSDETTLAHAPASSFSHNVESHVTRRCVECVLTFNPGLPHGAALAPSDRVWCLGVKSEARAVTFQLILSLHNRRHLRWGLASAVQGRVGPYAALEFVADFKQDSFEAFRAQLVLHLPVGRVVRARARAHTHAHTHRTHTHTHARHTHTHDTHEAKKIQVNHRGDAATSVVLGKGVAPVGPNDEFFPGLACSNCRAVVQV